MPILNARLKGCLCTASILIAAVSAFAVRGNCLQPASQYRGNTLRTGQIGYTATYSPGLDWQYSTGTTCSASPIIASNGTAYFGAYDRYFYAVEGNGSLAWRSSRYSSSIIGSAAVASNGIIYFATLSGSIYAFNSDGTSNWASPCKIAGAVNGSMLIGEDGTLYVGSDNNRIYAVDSSGAIKWSYYTGGDITRALTMSADGSVIYAPSQDGRIYAVSSNGIFIWKSAVINPSNNCAVGPDGTIYVGTASGSLVALNSDGSTKWTYPTQGRTITTAPAVGADGTIYVGAQDTCLHAINPDGTLKWYYRTNAAIYSSPTLDADGTIIFGTYSGDIVSIDPTDGSLNWSRSIGATIYTSPTIGSDGSIFVMDSEGRLSKFSGPVTSSNPTTPEPSAFVSLAAALAALVSLKLRRVRV
ncbi:PQQ-binding-like beta-propeller repeat protein [bacterium]|nr:PQQ-binding-like beta-propeller repeat protein [bacterium]